MIALWSKVVLDEILSKFARHSGQRFIYGINANSRILRLRKRKLQLLPLHFASSSGQKAKAPAFAYFI
jgi:hypothetical protein